MTGSAAEQGPERGSLDEALRVLQIRCRPQQSQAMDKSRGVRACSSLSVLYAAGLTSARRRRQPGQQLTSASSGASSPTAARMWLRCCVRPWVRATPPLMTSQSIRGGPNLKTPGVFSAPPPPPPHVCRVQICAPGPGAVPSGTSWRHHVSHIVMPQSLLSRKTATAHLLSHACSQRRSNPEACRESMSARSICRSTQTPCACAHGAYTPQMQSTGSLHKQC
jgi:hypothetical protein